MNIAIVGAGLIGRKRALALPKGIKLLTICDIDRERGLKFAQDFKCSYEADWKNVVDNANIQALIISTTNNCLSPIATVAISKGKHVLVEKPGAKNAEELINIKKEYEKNPVVVMFGYNHRYHPALLKAKEIVDSKKYGEVLFIRGRYGHGARLGYEKEWRFDKDISGGGELLDQGCHLIDLVNYYCGKLDQVSGVTDTIFWNTKLEDSAFFILKNNKHQIAHLSATCVEWKNIFSFEIMLKTAKIQIDGLGRSYGQEKLILYRMKPEMGPPEVEEFTFPEEDLSWAKENELFFNNIKFGNLSSQALEDALYVMQTIDNLYRLNQNLS